MFKKSLEIIGDWWFPDDENNKFKGKLVYIPSEGIKLEIYTSFGYIYSKEEMKLNQRSFNFKTGEKFQKISILNGFSNKNQKITLYNLQIINYSLNIQENKIKEAVYSVINIFIGYHFKNLEEILFDSFYFSITNIEKCIGKNPISSERREIFEENGKINLQESFKFIFHENLEYKINIIDTKLEFTQTFEENRSNIFENLNIDHKYNIEIKPKEKNNLDWYANYIIDILCQFFTILSNVPCYPRYMKGIILENGKLVTIDIYYNYPYIKSAKKANIVEVMPFELFGNNIENILNIWFEKNEKFKPVFELFFSHIYRETYKLVDFINLAQALEAFYNYSDDCLYINEKDYKKVKKKILESLPSDLDSGIRDKIKEYSNSFNHYNLKTVLIKLIEPFWEKYLERFMGKLTFEEFIDKVKNTRNYYTHYAKNLEKKAWKEVELVYPIMRLRLIFYLILMSELEILNDETFKIIELNRGICYLFYVD